MKRFFLLLAWCLLYNSDVIAEIPAVNGSMTYLVSMPEPHTHYFEVEILVPVRQKEFVDLKMPVWTPGSYLVREYAKNVEGFGAYDQDGESEIEFKKINKYTWRIFAKKEDNILVKYKVYAFEGAIRMSYLDESHGFIMANTLLMYEDELKDISSVLRLEVPDQWKQISTSLSRVDGRKFTYYIPNYDILVDSPIEIGNHEVIEFTAAGVPHELAMYGETRYDKEQLIRDLIAVTESATAIFGENPNEKYTFIVHHGEDRGGGLEHMGSTVLGVNRWIYSKPSGYKSFLSLAAHEYFHLWLVKRLKPVELEVIDYDQEVYTDLLWLMEGITSYYAEKILLNAGIFSEEQFLNRMLYNMADIRNTPGSREQSVAEASFDAWIKYYRRNENSINNQISYYNKGEVLGALLDMIVIEGSEGKKSLDDVIRELYFQYYKKKNKGITNDDLIRELERTCKFDFKAFFEDFVYGTKDIDYKSYLEYAGIELIETNGSVGTKSIGIKTRFKDARVEVASVERNGSAYWHGLSAGDELLAINQFRLTPNNYSTILNQYKTGEVVTILLSREGLIMSKEVEITKDPKVNFTYQLMKNRSNQQQRVYATWLGK